MKLILERALDFKRFSNIIVLNLIIFLILFGIISFEKNPSIILILILSSLFLFLTLLLFVKKGFEYRNNKYYFIFTIFGLILKSKELSLNENNTISSKMFISSNKFQKGYNSFQKNTNRHYISSNIFMKFILEINT
jgi:hypothetical protein